MNKKTIEILKGEKCIRREMPFFRREMQAVNVIQA